MFCPKCGSEYREGFTECADCGAALIEEKPEIINVVKEPHVKTSYKVKVLASAHLFIILVFIYRLLRTIHHGITENGNRPQMIACISIGITLLIIAMNVVAIIGLLRKQRIGWWASGVYLITQIPIRAMLIFYGVMSITIDWGLDSMLEDTSYEFRELQSSFYLIIISLFLIHLLFQDEVYNRIERKNADKKKSLIKLVLLSGAFLLFYIVGDAITSVF